MTADKPIRIFLPDTGLLISLALGDALDLLLLVADDVRLVLTDVVEFEAAYRADRFADAAAIRAFLHANAKRVEVIPTTIGRMALDDLRRRAESGESASLPKDLGELSITSFVISLRTTNPSEPMLVLMEDDCFAANAYALPGNVHLLSTSAWLDGLQALGLIPSAAALRAKIRAARPNCRAELLVDKAAEKIAAGTEWRSSFRRRARST